MSSFDMRSRIGLISKEFVPLSKELEWGYVIPYAICGMLDEHPKAALEMRKTAKKENYREFYESIKGKDLD